MDYELMAKLFTMAASLEEIGKELFALTDEQIQDPKCGKWIIDRYRQMQTAYTIRKSSHEKVDFSKIEETSGLPTQDMDDTTEL